MTLPSREMVDEYNNTYRVSGTTVMEAIERQVTGARFGATSYTTRAQADQLIDLLHLQPGRQLLEFGCGAGWPGIYLATQSGCSVTLTDVPMEGLRKASKRCQRERVHGYVVAADAAQLPFRQHTFDAVSSSDALC